MLKQDRQSIESLVAEPPEHRFWYILAVALLILSLIVHQFVVLLAGLLILAINLIPELWYHYALRRVSVRQQATHYQAFFREELTLSVSIENNQWFPVPWLEFEDESPTGIVYLSGHTIPYYKPERCKLIDTLSLWPFERVTRRYRIYCGKRGVYTFGSVMVRSGDPFGLYVREETRPAQYTVMVYPPVLPLPIFGLSVSAPLGEQMAARSLFEDPFLVAGVREYRVGDEPRHIHWKATARLGTLQSKVYEPSVQRSLFLLLEINTYATAWAAGVDTELQELTISAVASLAVWGLDEQYRVGLLANSVDVPHPEEQADMKSSPFMLVPLAGGHTQRERILSACARLRSLASLPLSTLIDDEHLNLPSGTTVALVSSVAAVQEATLERLLDLQQQGVSVCLALTGDPGQSIETYGLPVYFLGGKEIWHEFVGTTFDGTNVQATDQTSVELD